MLTEQFDFRPVTEADLDVMAIIEAEANTYCWNLQKFTESLAAGYQGWICQWVLDGQPPVPVAFALLSRVLDEGTLQNICVATQWQGQGIGRELLQHVLNESHLQGLQKLFLEVRVSNHRAIALYESFGFVRDGQRRDYYPASDGREDAWLYSLSLRSLSS